MYHQHHLPTTVLSTAAATRRRWSRRLLVAVAACVLGLLVGIPSMAPTGPAIAQAAQPYPPHAAATAGGMAGAVLRTGQGLTPDLLDDAVRSTGAPDEQLDVAAALDRGARLFFLGARYQDPGNGPADYYLAGPHGVSHQPLRALFAPLGAWLAAPGHAHEMVILGLRTDPSSANSARFDAACQAFISALGPYLLKPSDLPASKSFGELTPDEQAALRSRPRVVTDWSACTGEQLPIARPQARQAASVSVEDHWMADQADVLGQRPLRQVVLPGSHDAATYRYGPLPAERSSPAMLANSSRGALHSGPEPGHHYPAQRRQPLLRSALRLLELDQHSGGGSGHSVQPGRRRHRRLLGRPRRLPVAGPYGRRAGRNRHVGLPSPTTSGRSSC